MRSTHFIAFLVFSGVIRKELTKSHVWVYNQNFWGCLMQSLDPMSVVFLLVNSSCIFG